MDDKELIKEAFKEWLDEKVLRFGWWSLRFIAYLLVGYLLYFAANHGMIKG